MLLMCSLRMRYIASTTARIVAILDLENVCTLPCAEYLRRATAVLIVLCTAMFKTHPDYAGCGLT